MWLTFGLCIFFWYATIYLGIFIFILRKRLENGLFGFIGGLCLTGFTTYTSVQLYDFEYNFDMITGTTIGLGKPSKGNITIEYTYSYNGKKYFNTFPTYKFKVIYPDGKYEVRIAKRFPSFSRIDFSKPIE